MNGHLLSDEPLDRWEFNEVVLIKLKPSSSSSSHLRRGIVFNIIHIASSASNYSASLFIPAVNADRVINNDF